MSKQISPTILRAHPGPGGTTLLPDARRRRFLIAVPIALLALAACDKPVAAFKGIDLTGADYGRDFRLSDTEGKVRTIADFKGKAVMVFFGFTQCPDVCPTALARAVEVKRLLGAQGERLQVIFITIDPERDAPAMLKAYMQVFDPGFLALYGDMAQTAATAKEFKVYYKKVPVGDTYTMDHSALSYVFDPAGKLRLALRHNQNAQDFADDIGQLLS